MSKKILLLEDNADLAQSIADSLRISGYHVDYFAGLRDALDSGINNYELIISEIQTSVFKGIDLVDAVKSLTTDIPPIIFISAIENVNQAINAIGEGVFDYIVKPFDPSVLLQIIDSVFAIGSEQISSCIPVDKSAGEVYRLATRVAKSDLSVMISGESGTGKEVLARYIHMHSMRFRENMISINCAAIPETMLESLLFGYEKGAFTGAHQAYAGKFEQANGSTLLLDEITEMDINLQAKLLRVLQERQVERLGGKKAIDLDVRIIATTNRDIRQEVNSGRFREDLFYRLNVFPLVLPSLKYRKTDIIAIAEQLVKKHKIRCGYLLEKEPEFSNCAKQKMLAYDWPGNIRELENVIQRSLIMMTSNQITANELLFESTQNAHKVSENTLMLIHGKNTGLSSELQSAEQELIINALTAGHGNRKIAAEQLGISPRTLRYKLSKMREQGISIPTKARFA